MTREEFGQLELSEVNLLLRELEEQDQRSQLRDANFLCALLAPHRDPKKPPLKPQDFMPSEAEGPEKKMQDRLATLKANMLNPTASNSKESA